MISTSPSAGKRSLTLQEERHESDHEHQEDTDDAAMDPIEDGDKIVATRLTTNGLALAVVLANREFLVESSQIQH